ncbi:MAG: NUDIX hydrolase [Patescibacteria group bacterium]
MRALRQIDSKKVSIKLEHSAGGIVYRKRNGSYELLVVHRNQMNDWSLPKGHVERDEDIQKTAIREVKEETGVNADLVKYISRYSYLPSRKGKQQRLADVHWFLMKYKGGTLRKKNREISEARWIDIKKRFDFLDYTEDRAIVTQAKRMIRNNERAKQAQSRKPAKRSAYASR